MFRAGKSNSNPPLISPPILNLGERNTENCSNQTLIWFLTLDELSSGARDLLHLGALLRTLIRARHATTGLPAPPGTSPRLPSAPPQSQRLCLAARSETKAWREREGQQMCAAAAQCAPHGGRRRTGGAPHLARPEVAQLIADRAAPRPASVRWREASQTSAGGLKDCRTSVLQGRLERQCHICPVCLTSFDFAQTCT